MTPGALKKDTIELALGYAARGWPVFPCKPSDKRPYTEHGFKDASIEPDAVRAMFAAHPDALIGCPTGKASGFVVADADFDPEKGVDGIAVIGEIPDTVRAATPRGGLHYFFQYQPGITNSTGSLPRGVDIRGEGGYVILAGSRRADGKRYKWILSPAEGDIKPLPDHILKALKTEKPAASASGQPIVNDDKRKVAYGAAALARECDAIAMALNGRRNDQFFKSAAAIARLVAGQCLTETEARARLTQAAHASGLDTVEIRKTLDSAFNRDHDPRGPTENPQRPKPTAKPNSNEQKQNSRLVLTGREFVSGFVAPDYVIDRIVQQHYLYALTAPTGGGKTAGALLIAASVGLERRLCGLEVKQGNVLYLAGENADDVRARWLAMAEHMRFNIDTTPVFFIPGKFNIEQQRSEIDRQSKDIGGFTLIIIDTSATYFEGDNENDNVQRLAHAQMLRSLTELPSHPCVIALCHPVKNAANDNLLPIGGGAFLNELDGNLVCIKRGDTLVELYWQGKIRGPGFEPISFATATVECDAVRDSKGRMLPTVVAKGLSEEELKKLEAEGQNKEDIVLVTMLDHEGISAAQIAVQNEWFQNNKQPAKSLVQRIQKRLEKHKPKLVEKERDGTAILTTSGKEEAAKTKARLAVAGAKYP